MVNRPFSGILQKEVYYYVLATQLQDSGLAKEVILKAQTAAGLPFLANLTIRGYDFIQGSAGGHRKMSITGFFI